jgi:hypothetical protein
VAGLVAPEQHASAVVAIDQNAAHTDLRGASSSGVGRCAKCRRGSLDTILQTSSGDRTGKLM